MNFFTKLFEIVQIDDNNSITVTAPTYGQVQDANSKATIMSVDMTGKGNLTFDNALLEKLLMHICVTKWDGKGFDNYPVTPENIDALPVWIIARLRDAVNTLTKGIDPSEKKV